jgi:2-polyprenyl-3-methyl-5-hydroxy-6-metoxy-1,4-benzoquinol methylase
VTDYPERNRRAWNEVHRRRHESIGHQLGGVADILDRLEPLAGKQVLHLQCATGEATAAFVERGAVVTGVDIAEEAVAIAAETVPAASFVTADVQRRRASRLARDGPRGHPGSFVLIASNGLRWRRVRSALAGMTRPWDSQSASSSRLPG